MSEREKENIDSWEPEFYNRELSWLSFNYRVLQEAKDKSVPLFERLKFLAIYSSNLDEFFRVRVASLRSLLVLKEKAQKKLRFDPQSLLDEILLRVSQHQEEFGKIYREQIIPELNTNNIFIIDEYTAKEEQIKYLESFFAEKILPGINSFYLNKEKEPAFLHNRSIYLAVCLSTGETNSEEILEEENYKYALVEIHADKFGRFITLPRNGEKQFVIFLDDVLRLFLNMIFPDTTIVSNYSIKLTRDAELYIDDEFTGNLLQKIKKGLTKRPAGVPSRFLFDKSMPNAFQKVLMHELDLKKPDLMEGGKYHNYNDFFSFPDFGLNELKYEPMPPLQCYELEFAESVFETITAKDILLSFPYQSYKYVIQFLDEAANDPGVKSIKITLYRVATGSLVLKSLVRAVNNGKDVTAFVEVKARFDEEANFSSAEYLQDAGVKVYYSFPGLKVHSKLCVIERVEENEIQYYTYLATGNFNEKTAGIYCDHALLTKHNEIGKEAEAVFDFLTTKNEEQEFNHLLVASFNMRKAFNNLIDQEISNAAGGKEAGITIKLNSLEDRKMIKRLYQASQAGVKIRIIVRGICCLVPGVQGLSENIEVTSVVDRYLEHARIYIFHNEGDKLVYIASADWMRRNLSRRIEVGFQIYDDDIKKFILKVVEIQANDNVKARIIDEMQTNQYVNSNPENPVRSQYKLYEFIKSINGN